MINVLRFAKINQNIFINDNALFQICGIKMNFDEGGI